MHSPTSNLVARPSSRHITSLDGYRGIAFLLVFLRHYSLTRNAHSPILLAISGFGQTGWAGVDLFFVLSGFLITGILIDTRADAHYFRNFIARRALRIFPLYYAVLFGLLALTPLLHLQWHRGHILHFFYLSNVASNISPVYEFVPPYFSLLHLWSLSLEEQFYLLWPMAIYLAATPRRIIRLCLGLSVFALLARIAIIHWVPGRSGVEWCSAQLPTRMDGLLYGAIAAVLVRRFPMQRLITPARWLFCGSGILLTALFSSVGADFGDRLTTLVGYPLLAWFFASLLILALDPTSLSARFGSLRPLRFIGRYSYGLYIYHLIAWPAVAPLLIWFQSRTHSIQLGGILYTLTVFAGSLIMAIASYELYERHFLRLKRYFPYGQSTPAAAGAAITAT